MFNHYNPFKENRAEQMRDLWKYYVPVPGIDETGKPMVIVGGRGSGKTMLFQCNSWREVLSQIKKSGNPCSDLYNAFPFVGLYYRVDTTFVSSMNGRDYNNWSAIFETYFSICILQEVLDIVIALNADLSLNELSLKNFVQKFSKRLSKQVDNIIEFRSETDRYLDKIEDIINCAEDIVTCTSEIGSLRFINGHRLISDVCTNCNELFGKNILYKVFIDEYETLQEYQQKIINTYIKHSTLPVIFNIGLRPHGMKTRQTISKTETIEPPHDYEELALGIDAHSYSKILLEICKKRISLGKELGKIPEEAPDDIRYYLGKYSIEEELAKIIPSNVKPPYLNELRKIIQERGSEERLSLDVTNKCIKELCDSAPILNSRLHYVLLHRKTSYSPSLKEMFEAYITNSKKYRDWMHNRKFALVFLLAKDYKKSKMYFGFDVFAALSSNIVRYFLELCERAFAIAFLDDYKWDKPLDPAIQSEAAKYVSDYKIVDISGYEPYGKELRIFVQYLGQIFYRLHTSPLTTLGEPEPNHFSTKDLKLTDYTKDVLASAIMWNVLQIGEPTKRKQSMLSPETVDFYLNKIYVAYFGISYRNKRKVQLEVNMLEQLLSGDADLARQSYHQFFKKYNDDSLLNEASQCTQMTLFEKL